MATAELTLAPTTIAKPSRVRTITAWVAQVLLAAFFVFAATPKLMGDPMAVQSFETIGFGQWFRYLTGACELAGGIGLLIPRLAGPAALGLVGVMIGATLTNLFLLPGMAAGAVVTVALGAVFAVLAWYRRDQTRSLLRLLRLKR
jgi:putative oxidoreductase